MSVLKLLEIFTFATGIAYIILEILQRKSMWVLGFFTGLAAVVVFLSQRLFASAGLNIYYVVVSVLGYISWRRDSAKVQVEGNNEGAIHLRLPSRATILLSALFLIAGTIALYLLLRYLNDPMGWLDAFVTVLSAIATYWLAKSYIVQWWLWVVADILSFALCLSQGIPWMAVLYLIYSLSAVYGYFHWKKHGVVIC